MGAIVGTNMNFGFLAGGPIIGMLAILAVFTAWCSPSRKTATARPACS